MPTDNRALTRRRKPLFSLWFAAAAALAACDKPQPPQALPPAEVATLEVRPRDLPLALEYAAQLRGIREVEVRARVSGILLERRYEEGAAVKAGDLLFRIDPAPFRADAERARAELGVQQANLAQARRERDRLEPLYDQKLASLRDRDTSAAAFESAQAAVAAAEAALRSSQLNLSYTDVRAPIDGLTSREVRSEGSLVTAGADSSLLTYIVQADRLYIDIALPEGDAELVRAADDASPGAAAVRVVDARGAQVGPNARIEFIAPRVDDATGTVAVRAVLDNTGMVLRPGRVVRVHVDGVSVASSLVIPKRAILHGAQGMFVWVVGDGERVAARPVELGASSGNDVVVSTGLGAGERVVVDGILKVQPGAPVHATALAANAGAAAAGGAPPAQANPVPGSP
ncbi:MAG TPA: efflux RND transporter periplasmic adaptor subunit [Gammaproteobacteria bacterium]|nr:efflux RND transporter periplasmic adaptor subunit [Gammaproteobacteria bacterium]